MSALAARLRARLAEGRALGTFVKLPDARVLDLAAESLDFVVVDREHSMLGEAEALRLLHHAAGIGLPALLRLPALDAGAVNRALEAGAAGVQLSSVRDGATVAALRAACEYAPGGTRSVSLAQPAAGYGARSLADHVAASAGAALVVAQVEAALPRATIDAILAAGPDVAFVGTADLTVDAGFDGDRVAAVTADVRAAAGAAGVPLGAPGDGPGVRYLVAGSDLALLRDGLRAARRAAENPDRGGSP